MIADVRLKLEKETAPAIPCVVGEDSRGNPRTCTYGTGQSDSESNGACGKVMDHITEQGYVGSFTAVWYVGQSLFKKR